LKGVGVCLKNKQPEPETPEKWLHGGYMDRGAETKKPGKPG